MKALLSATFSELMPREAILMHGTAVALDLMNEQMADKMRPLAEKLDALQARGGALLSNEEIVALETDMRTMKEALAATRTRLDEAIAHAKALKKKNKVIAAGDGGRITVAADSRGVSYAIFAPDGSLEDAGDDWEPLVRRLETGLAGTAPAATVFWP